ncbi:MAG: ABC transporter substrate-binding protein [Reyranellaceae bacterium]
MNRRSLLAGLALAAGAAREAAAQGPERRRQVGVLSPFSPVAARPWHAAFEAGLGKLGWTIGSRLDLTYRYAEGNPARLAPLARELLQRPVELLVTEVTEATQAAKAATDTVPIVMIGVGDPVGAGLVASLARPGGNVTGLSQNVVESSAKRLELLAEVVPGLRAVGVLWNPGDSNSVLTWRELEAAARRLAIELRSLEVRDGAALEQRLATAPPTEIQALYVTPWPLFVAHLPAVAGFARSHRLASVFHLGDFAEAGGLLSYGPDRIDLFGRAASYVDRILRGASPADLPVEQPTQYDLVVNQAAARAIGLVVPPVVLERASRIVD